MYRREAGRRRRMLAISHHSRRLIAVERLRRYTQRHGHRPYYTRSAMYCGRKAAQPVPISRLTLARQVFRPPAK